MSQPRILVLGDAMLDRYWFADAVKLSAEAPVPVCKVTGTVTYPGGAANVAENLKALGAEVTLIHGDAGQSVGFLKLPEPVIPIKNRLVVGDTQIARWDENDTVGPISVQTLRNLSKRHTFDAIVVSDYNKGSISYEVIQWLGASGLPVFVDTKHPELYPATPTFFPNEVEYNTQRKLYDQRDNVILKLGAAGVRQLRQGRTIDSYRARARQVRSVCGAGDVVLANYVYWNTLGAPDALFRANLAAAIAVEKPYTSVVIREEIEERMKEL